MMIKHWILFFLILTIFSLPSAFSLGLTGNKLGTIVYEPGKIIENQYSISDTDKEVAVYLNGDLTEYITLSELVDGKFDMTIRFPEDYIPPAKAYTFELTAREIDNNPTVQGIGSLVSVTKIFHVEVYSYDKDLVASLTAPSVNEGTPVLFQVDLESRTYADIDSAKADITVYDFNNNTLGTVTTNDKPLKALSSDTLTARFDTKGLPAAEYRAEAEVVYDSKTTTAEAGFRIGAIDLVLKNYSSTLQQGFNDFSILVFNNWGNNLNNVYARVSLDGNEILQTPTISLAPWEEKELQGIVEITLDPQSYNGIIHLFFEGEQKQEPVQITVEKVVSPAEELSGELKRSQRNTLFLSVALGVLFVVILGLIVYYKLRKPSSGGTADDF